MRTPDSETFVWGSEGDECEWGLLGGPVGLNSAKFRIRSLDASPSLPASCAASEEPPHISEPQFLYLKVPNKHISPCRLTVSL